MTLEGFTIFVVLFASFFVHLDGGEYFFVFTVF